MYDAATNILRCPICIWVQNQASFESELFFPRNCAGRTSQSRWTQTKFRIDQVYKICVYLNSEWQNKNAPILTVFFGSTCFETGKKFVQTKIYQFDSPEMVHTLKFCPILTSIVSAACFQYVLIGCNYRLLLNYGFFFLHFEILVKKTQNRNDSKPTHHHTIELTEKSRDVKTGNSEKEEYEPYKNREVEHPTS